MAFLTYRTINLDGHEMLAPKETYRKHRKLADRLGKVELCVRLDIYDESLVRNCNEWKKIIKMLYLYNMLLLCTLVKLVSGINSGHRRQKRYLVFTKDTQFGVFATVSVPLSEPDHLVSMAWFLEANYYNVDNATYFDPLLGDIVLTRSRKDREARGKDFLTRSALYSLIEVLLEKHGYAGRSCLQRAICESASAYYSHNGVLGDLFQLILTPSASLHEEDLQDDYYEAEYHGIDQACGSYFKLCPSSPIDKFSTYIDHLL